MKKFRSIIFPFLKKKIYQITSSKKKKLLFKFTYKFLVSYTNLTKKLVKQIWITGRLTTLKDKGIDAPPPSSHFVQQKEKEPEVEKKIRNKKEKETIKNLNSWFKF